MAKVVALAAMVFAIASLGKSEAKAYDGTLQNNRAYTLSLKGGYEYEYSFRTPAKGLTRIEVALVSATNQNGESVWGYVNTKALIDYKSYWDFSAYTEKGIVSSVPRSLNPKKNGTIKINTGWYSNERNVKVYIKIVNEVPKNFETEGNNTATHADSLKYKKLHKGIVSSDTDTVDWYVFKAPRSGKYSFFITNTNTDGSWTYCTAIPFKNKHKQAAYGTSAYTEKGRQKIITVPLKKGQKYYIKVTNSYSKSVSYNIFVKR